MLNSVNKINIINNYKQPINNESSGNETFLNTPFRKQELSGFEVGQAILARNNISFRNLAMPNEITNKYNKKIEGKDHLDLQNIHVYEYPDTNLKLVLNIADKIKNPIVTMTLNKKEQTEFNPIISNLIKIMVNEKLTHSFDTDTYYENEGSVTSYFQLNNPNAIENFAKLNKFIFNMNFNEDELIKAKKELIEYINSNEYKNKNVDLRYLYNPNDFKTYEDLIKEIDLITIHNIQNYQENCLKNSEGIVYAVISQDSLAKDKSKIFQSINENIPVKLKTINDTKDIETFVPNSRIHYISGIPDFYPLNFNYKVSFHNAKESIIGEIVELILMDNDYIVLERYYDDPIDMKNPKQINTCLYLKINADITSTQNINANKEYHKFQDYVTKVYKSNLSNKLEEYKNLLKDDYKYDLQENENSQERRIPFSINEYFQIYELIDSITEQDIKDFIRKFIIEQEPIVHINDIQKYRELNCDKTN